MEPANLLHEYQRHRDDLARACAVVQRRIQEAIARPGTAVEVKARCKETPSLAGKLARPDRTYRSLWDVTDLIGLRVITYFEDDLAHVARCIERTFEVDFADSHDRLHGLEPQHFGYRSVHYVCAFPPDLGLPDGARFEIQARTMLQHVWAEIEHDLGYKGPDDVPVRVRRRFGRLAGLLELADAEFVAIRRETEAYVAQLSSWDAHAPLTLDTLSLSSLVQGSAFDAFDQRVSETLGRERTDALFFPDYLLKMWSAVRVRTTEAASSALALHGDAALELALPYLRFADAEWGLSHAHLQAVPRGYGCFFLVHAMVLAEERLSLGKLAALERLYRWLDYPDDPAAARRVSRGLFESFRRAGVTCVREADPPVE